MPPQGRLGDIASASADTHGGMCCAHTVRGPAVKGSEDVYVNFKPALRMGDTGIHGQCCGANTWMAVDGSSTVWINNRMAHRQGDGTVHCGGAGELIQGSPDVNVGD